MKMLEDDGKTIHMNYKDRDTIDAFKTESQIADEQISSESSDEITRTFTVPLQTKSIKRYKHVSTTFDKFTKYKDSSYC